MFEELQTNHAIIRALNEGRVNLFLGSGFSRGALNATGKSIPMASDLAASLSKSFLDELEEGFREAYQYSVTAVGARDVQKLIRSELDGFIPTPHHKILTEFAWKNIFTTNYDLLVELAYKDSKRKQNLLVATNDQGLSSQSKRQDDLVYYKLHGCITEADIVDPPLIATTDQIIDHAYKRKAMFDVLIEEAYQNPILFIGYSLKDENLYEIIKKVSEEGNKIHPHFIVMPNIKLQQARYWAEKRIRPFKADAASFFNDLSRYRSQSSELAVLASAARKTPFTKYISKAGASESRFLKAYIEGGIDFVCAEIDRDGVNPKEFFRGSSEGWGYLKNGYSIVRRFNSDVTSWAISAKSQPGPMLAVLKSHAGAGATVAMKQVAWDLALTHDEPVFFISGRAFVNSDALIEAAELSGRAIYIFVDDVANHASEVNKLIRAAKSRRLNIKFLVSERYNEWNNVAAYHLDSFVDHEFKLPSLSDAEVAQLLSQLEAHSLLGLMRDMPTEKQVERFKSVYNRQLLVALHEATRGTHFEAIIEDEFKEIQSREAQLMYLDVCSLHQFGVPMRAGLMARIHGIDFEEFGKKFLAPLEEVVITEFDWRTNDYVYRSRHKHVAELVYHSQLISIEERVDNIARIVSKLNMAFSYDASALKGILRATRLEQFGISRDGGRAIFATAKANAGEHPFLLHQEALFLLKFAETEEDFALVDDALALALDAEPDNSSFKHTEAEVALKRSRFAVGHQRQIWREQAVRLASRKLSQAKTSHAHHTIAKAKVDALDEAIRNFDDDGSEALLATEIREASIALQNGLDRFPSDSFLSEVAARYHELLADNARAERILKAAYDANPQVVLVALRLADLYSSEDRVPEAIAVLEECISHNSTNHDLHFRLGGLIIKGSPNIGDVEKNNLALYHFRRGYQKGDKRYDRRFWYARQLLICGEPGPAKAVFRDLKSAPLPYSLKTKKRGAILDTRGMHEQFSARVKSTHAGFAFLTVDALKTDVHMDFADFDVTELGVGEDLKVGVSFTMLGPAVDKII